MSDLPPVPSVSLSLKARENASRSLKRIFDQINESLPDQQRSVLSFLSSVEGSGGVNKFLERHLPDFPTQHTQDLKGLLQQEGTRDLLSLNSSGAQSRVQKEASLKISTKAPQQMSDETNFSSMPLLKEEPKGARGFGSLGRASFSAGNGRSDPHSGRLRSNQQEDEAPTDKLKEQGGIALPTAALTNEGKLKDAAHQQGVSPSYPEIGGNLGMALAALRPSSSAVSRKQSTGQMTIFYSGIVNVYDDVPPEKAHAIMLLAGSGNPQTCFLLSGSGPQSTAAPTSGATVHPATTGVPSTSGTSISTPLPTFPASVKPSVQRSHAELPFARKVSLARFLERRKDRVQSKAIPNSDDSAPEPPAKKLCSPSTSPSPAGSSR